MIQKFNINNELYVGLMSGTSLDGIDAALVLFDEQGYPQLQAVHYYRYSDDFRDALMKLCRSTEISLEAFGAIDVMLGSQFAITVQQLLDRAQVSPQMICAIGSHGHTVRHRPNGANPFTLQIGDPNVIAQLTGITTIADFRRRDLAVGGEGAPLVPAFHRAVFSTAYPQVILNIGGIANITWLPNDVNVQIIGFDTGPGNTLMDNWIYQHLAQHYDQAGHWASTGQVHQELLTILCADAYFARKPPKSTGTEYFNQNWLELALLKLNTQLSPVDIQATLCELTAVTIAAAIHDYCASAQKILVCGGGAHNTHLIKRIAAHLVPRVVDSTASVGIDPDWVEAMAFAWLARRTLHRQSGNLPAVTGAQREVILGGIYYSG